MLRALRISSAVTLALAFLNLTPLLLTSAQAAACTPTFGTVSGNSRYAIISSGSNCTWEVPVGVTFVQYFLVGGGGGGGGAAGTWTSWFGGGGGGAGGACVTGSKSLTYGTFIFFSVGSGGSGGSAGGAGNNGTSTSLTYSGITTTARYGEGGTGATGLYDEFNMSGDGGSNGTYNGGVSSWDGGGGGGGASTAGSNGIDIGSQGGTGGAGGAGCTNSLTGTTYSYGGGGGGGGTPSTNSNETNGFGGAGGTGGGGSGGGGAGIAPVAGGTNLGAGGGGGGWRSGSTDAQRAGAAGSAGVVVLLYTKMAGSFTSTSLSSTSGADGTYGIGDVINLQFITSEIATVTGSPRVLISGIGGSKYFTYSSGSGSTYLNFTYTVIAGDSASGGVYISGSIMDLNGGSIIDTGGAAFNLTHSNLAASPSHKVDGVRPTVTYSASNNVAENETASVRATLSETGTITLGAGYDRAHITFDSATSTFYFGAHDFENPQDADLNNQYYVNFTIRDEVGNTGSGTYNIFFTVTNVAEAAQVGVPTLSAGAQKGVVVTITVTATVEGKFTFYANGKKIAGCIGRATTGSSPNFSASCSWKPTVRAEVKLSAAFKPTSSSYSNSNTSSISVVPRTRAGAR